MPEKRVGERRGGGGLVWPVLLILAGVLFLLDNLNVINFDFWYAATRLWPIVLIAIGLDLLVGRRSWLLSLLVVIITIGMLALGFIFLDVRGGGDLVEQAISQSLDGAEAAEVDLDFGVGEMRLSALDGGADELIAGEIRYPQRGVRVRQSFDMEGDTAVYALNTSGSFPPSFGPSRGEDWRWDLQLNPDVPIALEISTGVGESHLDLRQLNLSSLDVDSGVGETTVTLPGEGRLAVTIDGGVGELVVEIPAGVAARINSDTGLGQTDVQGDFSRDGDVYVTANYDSSALDRIDLDISAGIGQVTIRTYGGR